jgi:uncharacterized damage-inducible protein DinB
MRAEDIRFLFGYDRWATERVLAVLDEVPAEVWSAVDVVGERGLGHILVHQLGAAQRWRHGIQRDGREPEPELEPLPTIVELRARWVAEWEAVDAWLPTLDDAFLAYIHEGVAIWQMLAHVVNRDPAPLGGCGAADRSRELPGRARHDLLRRRACGG